MSEPQKWFNEKLGLKAVAALNKNRFKAEYVKTKEEAHQRLLELIPPGVTVGLGGSVTISQLDVVEELKKRGNHIYNHSDPSLSPDEKMEVRRKQLTSDVFLSGTNAVTLDGKLVNEDGHGNRVAAMTFGPKQVLIVVGTNKIVRDVDSALERLKMYAAPMNNYRLGITNPCVKTGLCIDCDSDRRICNVISIMNKKPTMTDITIIIVGEELGL